MNTGGQQSRLSRRRSRAMPRLAVGPAPHWQRPLRGHSLVALVNIASILAIAALILLQARRFDVRSGSPSQGSHVVLEMPTPAWKKSSRPIKSAVGCGRVRPTLTTRELDLQQQRRCVLDGAAGRPEGGYLAACLAVKNQHRDLPEWLDWHSRLGVSKFYVMDDNSDPPLDDVLAPYVADGRVEHRVLGELTAAREAMRNATCHTYDLYPQLLAYSSCLLDYGARHQWMAFIDADEFLVLMDGTPDLPSLLRDYEQFGGLAVNWRMFGSNGHMQRQNDTLTAYTACFPAEDKTHLHIKTIANMAFTTRTSHAHHPLYAPGYFAVTASRRRVVEAFSSRVDYSRLALHHYFTKSREDFAEKKARGGGTGAIREDWYWDEAQQKASQRCMHASRIQTHKRRAEASRPAGASAVTSEA